jgi:hypothetical protein
VDDRDDATKSVPALGQRRDGCVNATPLRAIERYLHVEESRLGGF